MKRTTSMDPEVIRKALAEELREGALPTRPLATVDASDAGPGGKKFLTNITETPSGKTYGLLTVGAAERWLKSLGMRLAATGELSPEQTYTVEVDITGTAVVDVLASCEEDAIDEVREMFLSDLDPDLDFHYSVVSRPASVKAVSA